MLDIMEPADRKRLRAIARAFAPTVGTGDMLRFAVTRILEKRLAKAVEAPSPVPLPERAAAVCELFTALAQCRFGAGKQGQNAYRAGSWACCRRRRGVRTGSAHRAGGARRYDCGVAQIHPTGKRSFSEGMARVIAVGGQLTVPQVDLLRATCLLVDCAVPALPIDVVYEDSAAAPPATQLSAR
jgi:hypothetical protein